MKNVLTLTLAATFMATLTGCASSQTATSSTAKETKTYKVAVVKQLDHASLDEIAKAICDEFDAISEKEGVKIEYGDVYSGQNDQTVLQQIGSQVTSEGVDAIVPVATLAAQTMTVASDGTVPVVFAAISDPEAADLTGIDYVTGTSDALNTKQIMEMMLKANPDMKTVGLYILSRKQIVQSQLQKLRNILMKKVFNMLKQQRIQMMKSNRLLPA